MEMIEHQKWIKPPVLKRLGEKESIVIFQKPFHSFAFPPVMSSENLKALLFALYRIWPTEIEVISVKENETQVFIIFSEY